MRISDAIEEYLLTKQNSISHDTLKWYSHFLNVFAQWTTEHRLTDLSQVRASHVQEFVADCPTKSSHSRHARAQVVKGFLSWCSLDDEAGVQRKTVERIEMPRLIQPDIDLLDESDIAKLINVCEVTKQPHRNRAIIHLLLDTGIRASELCYDSERPGEETGLRMENLFIGAGNDNYIRVMGKGKKARTIGLGSITSLMVKRYLNRERAGINSDYVLLERDGAPLSVRMLQQLLARLGELSGIENVHPHRFRHTFAVNQLLAGTSDLVLMRLLGHTTLDSTKIYTRAMSQMQARQSAISVVDHMRRKKR